MEAELAAWIVKVTTNKISSVWGQLRAASDWLCHRVGKTLTSHTHVGLNLFHWHIQLFILREWRICLGLLVFLSNHPLWVHCVLFHNHVTFKVMHPFAFSKNNLQLSNIPWAIVLFYITFSISMIVIVILLLYNHSIHWKSE